MTRLTVGVQESLSQELSRSDWTASMSVGIYLIANGASPLQWHHPQEGVLGCKRAPEKDEPVSKPLDSNMAASSSSGLAFLP